MHISIDSITALLFKPLNNNKQKECGWRMRSKSNPVHI